MADPATSSGHGDGAEVVLPCAALDPALAFFAELGFRLEAIFPADEPSGAVLSGHGLRLRLARGAAGGPGELWIPAADRAGAGRERVSPDGTRVLLVDPDPPLALPALRPSLEVVRARDGAWKAGRAGMAYRDLLPSRQGGRFVAAHIRIEEGGPVPDYVHFHRVRFQVIWCRRGEVRVAYQDQGEPFVLRAGDCVLQPPGIRHRVLACSAGLEVVEVSCPAEHETRVEHALALPNLPARPGRSYGGQRFARHVAEGAPWAPVDLAGLPGFEARDTGVAAATDGLASVRALRARAAAAADARTGEHAGELLFLFVLRGAAVLRPAGRAPEPLAAGDACAVPPGLPFALDERAPDLELLEVRLPAS